jgi:hypothetical protein
MDDINYKVIYTPYITVKGRRIYAYQYGKKVFRFVVPVQK